MVRIPQDSLQFVLDRERGSGERERPPHLIADDHPTDRLSVFCSRTLPYNDHDQLRLPFVALIGRSPRSTLGVLSIDFSPTLYHPKSLVRSVSIVWHGKRVKKI